MFTQLTTEVLKSDAAVDAGDVEEHFINTVLFHARGQRLKAAHDAF
jgi:hypothetical protein